MPKNSIQFQKGFSIPEFMQMYGTARLRIKSFCEKDE